MNTNAVNPSADWRRAQLVSNAVVSAYIHEISGAHRRAIAPQRRPMRSRSRDVCARRRPWPANLSSEVRS